MRVLSTDLQPQLVKYLLKTNGQDICNEISLYVATECNLNYADSALTPEQRNKIAQDCGQEYKAALVALNKTVAGASIDEFLEAAETALESCSMVLKKVDKKKDRTLVLCHKHALLEQLANCREPALTLHLTALTLFTIVTQSMLHASGKFVSSILGFLHVSLSHEQNELLRNYHDLVLKLLTATADTEEMKQVTTELDAQIDAVKAIAISYRKPGSTSADA